MQRLLSFLDNHDASKFGIGGEPPLDHIVAPIRTGAAKGFDDCGTAALTGDNDAASVQRGVRVARGEVKDLERPFHSDAGGDIEHEAIDEKCGVEGGKWSRGIERRRFETRTKEFRPFGYRRCRRSEPHTRRKAIERGQLGQTNGRTPVWDCEPATSGAVREGADRYTARPRCVGLENPTRQNGRGWLCDIRRASRADADRG